MGKQTEFGLRHRYLRELPYPSEWSIALFRTLDHGRFYVLPCYPGLHGPRLFWGITGICFRTAYPGLFKFIPVGDGTMEGLKTRVWNSVYKRNSIFWHDRDLRFPIEVNKAIGNHSTHRLFPKNFGFVLGTAKHDNSLKLFDNFSGQT